MGAKEKNRITTFNKPKGLRLIAVALGIIALGVAFISSAPIRNESRLPQSRDIFTLYNYYNMTVLVVFDEEPPAVQFVDPNGNYVDMNNIRYRTGSNFTQYFLPNAMPGVWSMNYDPKSNAEITTPYSVYMEHIFIRGFEAALVRDGNKHLPVAFEVSSDDNGEFAYELYAVFTAPDNSITKEVLLKHGYGTLNEMLNLAIDGDGISDMGGFILRLTASIRHGQATVQDTVWFDLRLMAE